MDSKIHSLDHTFVFPLITKELENKCVVWFQNSNQYSILEPLAAEIILALSQGKEVPRIAQQLEKELAVPLEQAMNFVIDLRNIFVTPDLEAKSPKVYKRYLYSIPKDFKLTKYYLINTKILKVQFLSQYEASLIHPKFAHLETTTHVYPNAIFQIFKAHNLLYLLMNTELIGSWDKNEIHYFQGKFSMKLIETMYGKLEDQWMGIFHASALSNGKHSLLLSGDSGNGKSTSLALLQAHGFQCVADDFVPIDIEQNVCCFPSGISIKKNSLKTLLPFYPELEHSAEFYYKRLNKIVRYLPPNELSFDKTFPCKALIFIKYDSNVGFEFEEITKLQTFKRLIPDSWISQEPKNVSIFLDWFSSLPCYQLTYSINEKMIHQIGCILNNDL